MAATTIQTQSILRGRRQSQFPPNSFNNNPAKAPRKSIGPGTFVPPEVPEEANNVKGRPSAGSRKSSTESKSGLSLRLINRKKDNTKDDAKKDGILSPRVAKAKSLLTPKTQSSNDLLTPSRTPDTSRPMSSRRPMSSHQPHTPSKRSGTPGRTTTPGAANNRRMSVMPAHASGLGARTISPTDARRMKRMSTLPPAPPLPQNRISQAPPTPQPEPVPPRPRSTAQSPGLANRKSTTPSSSRTTPDPNRKSYSSGQSLSSATSYGSSVRNSASINARLSQTINSSRLPTPKPKLDIAAANNWEPEVPPVPAIPKAFESPGSEFEQPFFSARSSSLPPVDTPITASPPVSILADAMKALETPRAPSSSSKLSNFQAETELRQKPQPKSAKKGPAARLPPLNLLPLSTPTAAKIKAFKDSRVEAAEPSTPPAYRTNMKTPSTPMTASKASFFSRGPKGSDEQMIRSNTSHFALRPDPLRIGNDSPSLPVFSFESGVDQDRNISPFVSSSLPKTNDFANFMRPNFTTGELNRMAQPRPNGPRAPSFSVSSTSTPKLVQTESPVEKQPPAFTESSFSGLRRKLSRKKSEPKVQDALEGQGLSKYDNMPPPKLPASATWSNNLSSAANPGQSQPLHLRSRRQTSSSSLKAGRERQESIDGAVTHLSGRPSIESNRSLVMHGNRSGSLSQPQQPRLAQRAQDLPLDRDDMVAEEEMKKLASKRRDFESAARELDGLRARACPARRMSANTAAALHNLNIFERGEIVDFPDIYFAGDSGARKIVGDPNTAATNFGYDDERGDYNIVEGDHLAYRYEVVDLLGKGSFGQVVRCIDHMTGILVAVKIIRNKKRFHQQALVEVNILQKLKEWVSRIGGAPTYSLTITRIPTRNIVLWISIKASTSVAICVSQPTFWV